MRRSETLAPVILPLSPRATIPREALIMGGLGVLCFSFTFPATYLADPAFGGVAVGLGRAVIAAGLAALVLALRHEPWPARKTWKGLFLVASGVVIGFPLCSALALQHTSVAHGAVITGLLPGATAVVAVLRAHERPPGGCWGSGALGTLFVLLFAFVQGGGHFQGSDIWMFAAVGFGAIGYTEGGRLAREMGGWRVICWALLIAFPIVFVATTWAVIQHPIVASPVAWGGLLYVAVFSMFLGFFAWYRGLALGGIARVGQLQLLQPLLTISWAALFLGESLTVLTGVTALLVVLSVAVGQRGRLRQSAVQAPPRQA
jgi:drug/metabolite transporter (DMT)-like permease